LAELFMPRSGQYAVFQLGVKSDNLPLELLFETDVPTSSFEVDGQRGMPSAGIALSIKPTVLLCRRSTEHSPCGRTAGFFRRWHPSDLPPREQAGGFRHIHWHMQL
jgi:hypothetical protein